MIGQLKRLKEMMDEKEFSRSGMMFHARSAI